MNKILVADDEKDVVKVLSKRLADAGYEVFAAYGGKEAVQKAKEINPDLVLLDIVMPDLDGGEVEALLKEDPATENIPIIFITGLYTKGEERNKGHIEGGNVFLAKPFETEDLLRVVAENIRK